MLEDDRVGGAPFSGLVYMTMQEWKCTPGAALSSLGYTAEVPWWLVRDVREIGALVEVWGLHEASVDSSCNADQRKDAGKRMRSHPFYPAFVDAFLTADSSDRYAHMASNPGEWGDWV